MAGIAGAGVAAYSFSRSRRKEDSIEEVQNVL